MFLSRQQRGKQGENAVVAVLQRRGFVILAQNVYTRYGELDVIACKNGVTHVIEVKTRTSDAFGSPESALTQEKLRKIRLSIQQLQYTGKWAYGSRLQIDFASVMIQNRTATIQFYWNVGADDL